MGWEKIENNVFRFENKGEAYEGKLINKTKTMAGQGQYTFERGNKTEVIFGSVILDSLMVNAQIGEWIRIEYKGKGGKNGTMRLYELYKYSEEQSIE